MEIWNGDNYFSFPQQRDVYIDADLNVLIEGSTIRLHLADTKIVCSGNMVIEDLCELENDAISLSLNADEEITIYRMCSSLVPEQALEAPVVGEIVIDNHAILDGLHADYVADEIYWSPVLGFLYAGGGSWPWLYSFDAGWLYTDTELIDENGAYFYALSQGWYYLTKD